MRRGVVIAVGLTLMVTISDATGGSPAPLWALIFTGILAGLVAGALTSGDDR